jgi:glycosyltransferase involved in cell wall biosynthesis
MSHFTQPHLGILCLSKSLGGLELNTIRFAEWLKQRGWKLTLFLLPDTPIAEKAVQKNLPVSYTNKSFKYFDIWNASKLAKQIDAENIEILLFTNNKDTSMVAWVKGFCKKLKVIYQQQMQIGVSKKDLLHTLRFGIIDAWISPLKWLANEVSEKTKYNPDKVHIIPLGTELDKFIENDYTRASARKELQLSANTRIIGILGRIDPHKGQDFLIKAVHYLNTELNEDVELLIMGEPTRDATEEYLPYLKQLVEDLGMSQKIHFRNFTEKPEIFYKAIDVFGMASVNETFGMVTIEAMASGVPVVATASGSNPELLRKGGLGFLYQPGNLQEFAICVKQCFDNPRRMKRFGELAKREAQRKYSHTRQCQHTEQLIWQIL